MSEKSGLDNSIYNILSSLGKDAYFLYDIVDKYISDTESSNKTDLAEVWKTIRNERQKHVDLLKDALQKNFTNA